MTDAPNPDAIITRLLGNTVIESWEEARLGRLGIAVREDYLASAWEAADADAAKRQKRVIQDETPQVFRRDNRLHWFFPYDPPING